MFLKFKKLLCFIAVVLFANNTFAVEDPITIGEVSKISLDEIGILTTKQGGFGSDLWANSNRNFVETLLVKLNTNTPSEVAKDLRKRILLSSAVAPQITGESSVSFIDLRLNLLALSGDAANIAKILAVIPPARVTEQMQQDYVSALFLSDDYANACTKNAQMQAQYKSVFWRQASIICKAFSKKKEDVDLSTTLLKEDGTEISKEFLSATSGLIKDGSGKKDWNEILQKTVLALPIKDNQLPAISKNLSVLPAEELTKKLKDIEALEKTENIAQITNLYATAQSLGAPISKAEWQAVVAYAISNDIIPPALAMEKLLDDKTTSKGEAILLIVYSLNNGAKKIPVDLLAQMVGSLHRMDMDGDAKRLAGEGLF